MNYRMIALSTIAWAMAGMVLATPGLAQDAAETKGKPHPQADNRELMIPACLEHLSLTSQQQNQIRQIVRDYDADQALVWDQFSNRYMETLETEAMLLVAIEDNLTEAQRTQVREQRRKTAQHQKSVAEANDKANQAVEKPDSAVEGEIAIVGVSLTEEQEAAADMLQDKCLGHLRSLNRDVYGLHLQLLSLETDKLVAIEKVLTQEQLRTLRENRQNTPIESTSTDNQKSPATSR